MNTAWKGLISLGLLSISVKAYRASDGHRTRFRLLCPKCNQRLNRQLFCKNDGLEVQQNEAKKGYITDRNELFAIEPEELEALRIEAEKVIKIVRFVPADIVDKSYYGEKTYFVAPAEGSNTKAFRLLSHALKLKNLTAIGKFVIDEMEHIVALSSYKKGLIMQTLRYEDEVRNIQEIETISALPSLRFTHAETSAILRLIDKFTIHEFDLSDFADEYSKRVVDLINTKTSGQMFMMSETEPPPVSQDDDLLRLLQESAA